WSWGLQGNDSVMRSVNGGRPVFQFHSDVLIGDAWTAVARLDSDPHPEVIAIYGGGSSDGPAAGLWIFKHDGSLYQPPVGLFQNVSNTVSYLLGPPTVADFDGDGQPEIAFAAYRRLVSFPGGEQTFQDHDGSSLYVIKLDGTEVWHREL